jgi:hypothetical protein
MLRTIQMEHIVLDPAIVAGEAGAPELPLLKLGLVGGRVLILGPVVLVLWRRLRGPLALGAGHPKPSFCLRDFSLGRRLSAGAGAVAGSAGPDC